MDNYIGMKILQYSAEVGGIVALANAGLRTENPRDIAIQIATGLVLYVGGRILGDSLNDYRKNSGGEVERIASEESKTARKESAPSD